jgi:hypothetical protein
MRSHRSAAALLLVLAAAAPYAAVAAPPAAPAAAPPPAAHGPVSARDAQAAVEALRTDPRMGGMERHRRLHWREPDVADAKPAPWLERVLRWFAQFGAWVAGSARALVLVAVTICVALLGVLVWRAWRRQPQAARAAGAPPPTHVRGLDIRPDELPADVPGAARALWSAGDRRAALVLLYRSLLSRLAHGFQVPIRDSSTEGDCLSLARGRVPEAAGAYAGEFVRTWLAAMYAGQWPGDSRFEALCEGHWQLQGTPP